MKKVACIAFVFILVLLTMQLGVHALPYDKTSVPELIITEIVPKTLGKDGSTTRDSFEFMEVYNTSANQIDLYEYGLVFRQFESNAEVYGRYTPIQKNPCEGLTQVKTSTMIPSNPDTALLDPGKACVIWFWGQYSFTDEVKTVAEFRQHWNITEDVLVLIVDSNVSTDTGNNVNRFELCNSNQRMYGIVKKSEAKLSSAGDGAVDKTAASYDELICYCYWRLAEVGGSVLPEVGTTFVYTDSTDIRSSVISEVFAPATPGELTEAQKKSLGITATAVTTAAPKSTTTIETTKAPDTTAAAVSTTVTETAVETAEITTLPVVTTASVATGADTGDKGGCGSAIISYPGLVILISAGLVILYICKSTRKQHS